MEQLLGRTFWQHLLTFKMHISYDGKKSFLGICPSEMEIHLCIRDTCVRIVNHVRKDLIVLHLAGTGLLSRFSNKPTAPIQHGQILSCQVGYESKV